MQGKPIVKDVKEAREIMDRLNLPAKAAGFWIAILGILFNSASDRGLSADQIVEGLFPEEGSLRA